MARSNKISFNASSWHCLAVRRVHHGLNLRPVSEHLGEFQSISAVRVDALAWAYANP